jgi:DNA polymerase phi
VLALLRRPSAFVKAFAGPIVLKGFAGEIGQQAIELLGDVVAPADEVEDGIEADADAEEEEEAEGADKAQKKQAKGAKAGSDSDDSDDSEEDDSSDDDEDGLEVDEAFKNELLAALEAGGMGVPNAASDDDDDEEMKGDESDEEELLDDEAMLALDDRLADIFRANGGGRRSKKREWIHPRSTRVSCMTDPICSQQVTARTTCTTASVVSTCSTSSRTPSRRLRSSSRSTSPSST